MTISEEIKQKPIKNVVHEPTKMSKKELEEYAKIVAERAKIHQEQVDNYLKGLDGTNNSTKQSA